MTRKGIENFLNVHTGAALFEVGDRGVYLIQAIRRGDRLTCGGMRLVCRHERRHRDGARELTTVSPCTGVLHSVAVEQAGPVRAVIRMEGMHRDDTTHREWLPFVVRLEFYAGLDVVRIVHTFVYDGRAEEDFIAGLGLTVHVPLQEGVHNRHIRFAGGGGGAWVEPARYLSVMDPALDEQRGRQLRAEAVETPA